MQQACHVKRSWYGQRRRALLIATILLITLLLFMIKSRHQLAIIKPGNLSNPHAQILAATVTSQRCAACHPQASNSDNLWFNASSAGHQHLTQTDACLDCHHKTIPRKVAKLAHNLDAQQLAELRLSRQRLTSLRSNSATWQDLLPGPAVDLNNIQCATCHREHRGANADLLAISDTQCQTCHSDRFGDFATSHPDWQQWPYGRGGEISFNHATHANKHYPATRHDGKSTPFQCAQCHQRNTNNDISRAASYQVACSSCHDEVLKLETAEGLNLLALPILSPESAARVQLWPEAATGFYDGTVSPLAELLLQADPDMAKALTEIPNRDFATLETPAGIAAAETVAQGIRQLINEIASQGQPALIKRSQRLGLTPESVQTLLRALSPQLVEETRQIWFPQQGQANLDPADDSQPETKTKPSGTNSNDIRSLPDDSTNPNDLLGPDLQDADLLGPNSLSGDSLLIPQRNPNTDPLALEPLATGSLVETEQTTKSPTTDAVDFDADSMLPAGGWFRDDQGLAIRYRGSDHDDPVLKAMIDIIRQLPAGEPARERLLQNRAIAACIECHPGAIQTHGSWRSRPVSNIGQFTKFSHASHLNVAQLSNCIECHRVAGKSSAASLLQGTHAPDSHHSQMDFLPLTRESCSGCHRPGASGDNCTTCHRYHIDLRNGGTISINH